MTSPFDARPIIVALAGPNGAGKSTFYLSHLEKTGLRYLNPDKLAVEAEISAEEAARLANELRAALVQLGESFIFETVLSDPYGDKVEFLREAVGRGYTVVLCFIGVSSAEVSRDRVSIRVAQKGHDVPDAKISSRFPRTLANLERAISVLPHVLVFDNEDFRKPFRKVAVFHNGSLVERSDPIPTWLESLLP